jgi:tetraacyldisaccharide 4'-kinase
MSPWVERHWSRLTPLSALLYIPSALFQGVVALRRVAYRASILPSRRLPAPVIVVGNITVGGTGKTPLVLWLTNFLQHHGMRPGIVSRGYGAQTREPMRVTRSADAGRVGDEPLLLAQRSGCPVWVGQDRAAAGEALLRAHSECNVIVSDDGLQHYALQRDIEIAVVDGARGFGNGLMLPAGPLREPVSRLDTVDAVVVNGLAHAFETHARAHPMKLEGHEFRNLLNPDQAIEPADLRRQRIHAVAGIGNPQRFFAHLETLGLRFQGHAFADHHRFTADDLAFKDADAIVMTEKDAVKCAAFATEKHWALRVDAVPDPALGELVLRKLKK